MAEDAKNESDRKKPVLPSPDAKLRDIIRKGLNSDKEDKN